MNEPKLKRRVYQAYRLLAWKIFVYLKANNSILNDNNNKEVFNAVREIQIRHFIKVLSQETYESVADIVDTLGELEAKRDGLNYFIEQQTMDYYRPSSELRDEREMIIFTKLLLYNLRSLYTKKENRSEDIGEEN